MASPLLPQQIRDALVGLDGWEYDGVKVSKVFKLKDFPAALVFTNRVGAVAEQMNHHPDIHLCWNVVNQGKEQRTLGSVTERKGKIDVSPEACV